MEALAVLCDLLTDTMAEQLLAAYSVSMESIVPSTKSSSQKRKANWETALEVFICVCVTMYVCMFTGQYILCLLRLTLTDCDTYTSCYSCTMGCRH